MNSTSFAIRINSRSILATSLATALIGLSVTGHAADQTGPRPPSTVVHYGDLDLTSAQGVQRLYQRIVGAAKEVCNGWSDRELNEYARHRICIQESTSRAVAAVGKPALAALHAAKSGPPTKRVAEVAKR
jgi:UrcA family protein